MERPHSGCVTAALAVTVLALAGCSAPRGVSIHLGADELEPCEGTSIHVEDLEAAGEPGCDLAGSTLVFPDGMASLAVPQVGAVFSHQDFGRGNEEILIVNWGLPGVATAVIDDDRLIHLWASSEDALDLQWQQLELEGVKRD